MLRLAVLIMLMATIAVNAYSQSLSKSLAELDSSEIPANFSQLANKLMPAVVNISTTQIVSSTGLPSFPEGSPLERFNEFFENNEEGIERPGALGSGFVISSDGFIVTNYHVIEKADGIQINFHDGRTLDARIIGSDQATDLAVLKVESEEELSFVEFADSDMAGVGDWVIAIGNPFGFGGSVSAGIVSARNRDIRAGRYDDFIQTDAAINQGNSGGPLFNLAGQVLGVNTAIVTPSGGSVGIGFSIPANLVVQITNQILRFGKVERGWLGVNVQNIDEGLARAYGIERKSKGVIITAVDDEGPASEAGVEIGDLLLSFDGRTIDDVRTLTRIVAETPIGTSIILNVVRDGLPEDVWVKIGELKSEAKKEKPATASATSLNDNEIGMELTEIDDSARRRFNIPSDVIGVLVKSVSPRGPSYGKLQKGDVITEISFQLITTVDEAKEVIEENKIDFSDRPLLFRVNRKGQNRFYSVDINTPTESAR